MLFDCVSLVGWVDKCYVFEFVDFECVQGYYDVVCDVFVLIVVCMLDDVDVQFVFVRIDEDSGNCVVVCVCVQVVLVCMLDDDVDM